MQPHTCGRVSSLWKTGGSVKRLLTLGVGALAALMLTAAPAFATGGGPGGNSGDVWVANFGDEAGPGHAMDPKLDCRNINLWGDKMSSSGGSYRIYTLPPSGWGASAYSATWSYNRSTGGSQVM